MKVLMVLHEDTTDMVMQEVEDLAKAAHERRVASCVEVCEVLPFIATSVGLVRGMTNISFFSCALSSFVR